MCGIAGIATLDGLRPDDRALLDRMLGSIAHRGPDDQHVVADDVAAIGARRLSIIDLDTGRQPLTDESGSFVASLNGELYEYVELRERLRAGGHRLRSSGDTEVIAHLYEDLGDRFVDEIRGMFAIAVWDRSRRRLVLARDRLGKKPLYYRVQGDRLLYGSELKALLVDPDLARHVDPAVLARYFQHGYVPGEDSILRGVRKVPPASVLSWDGGEPVVQRYWAPTYEPKLSRSMSEDIECCLGLIRDAVRLRLRSDVPVGAFLSGGIDSSLIVALMAELSPVPVRTFSIGFDDEAFNELPHAREVAQRFATTHTEEIVQLDAAAMVPDLARTFDEPLADTSAVPTFRIAQVAAREVKVVLTGDGGDEAFAGYRTYRRQVLMEAVARIVGPLQPGLATVAAAAMPPRGRTLRLQRQLRRWARDARLPLDERYVAMMTLVAPELRRRLLRSVDGSTRDGLLLTTLSEGPTDVVDRMLRADTLTYLPDDLLVKMDRATMAASLEARAPLLDSRIVEFASRLPAARKVNGLDTKVLLRAVAARVLPPEITSRPKMGFSVPIDTWFRANLATMFSDLVLAPDAASRDHLDTAVASTLLADHLARRADHGAILWALLMFETWARTWLAGPALTTPPAPRRLRPSA